MNIAYLALLFLSMPIFLDYKFYRVLVYSTVFNILVALLSMQTDVASGIVLLVFGGILFPLIMRFAIKSTEKEERESMRWMIGIMGISAIALFLFLSYLGITMDHILLFMIFALSIIALLIAKNLLKFLFIFDVAENVLILAAYSFLPINVYLNLSEAMFIEIATILPFILLTYLTIHMYKKYRSLNPWHLWQ